MEFTKVITDRYSCRSYKQQAINDDVLEKILNAGSVAPTAKNNQPQIIYVCTSKEALQKVDTLTRCRFGAPCCMIVTCDEALGFVNTNMGEPDYNSVEVDGTIVATHMVLEAYNQGVGSCIVRLFNANDVQKAFEMPQGRKAVLMLMMGYPAEDAVVNPRHYTKKELSQQVIRL